MLHLPSIVARQATHSHMQIFATALCFFSLGFSTAAWAPLIPLVQNHLQISHAQFGVLLLGAGIGSMIAMPIAGKLAHRLGCRRVLTVLLVVFMLIVPSLAYSPHVIFLAISLVLFGASAGALGVTVNLQAVTVEKQQQKSLMSLFHGICSLGGLTGVVLMTAMLSFGWAAVIGALVVSAVIAMIILIAIPFCLTAQVENEQTQQDQKQQGSVRPSFSIILIGLICFIAFLSEGAAMDWSGIYLTEHFKVQQQHAGLAYSCFAALMVAGRLTGHWIIRALGEQTTLVLSAVCAGLGLMTVVFAPIWSIALLGYALLGLGSANIVPIMFSRTGKQKQLPQHIALSYVSVFAYTGSLTGPALVGFGSQVIGLDHVFLIIAIGLILIAVMTMLLQTEKTSITNTETLA